MAETRRGPERWPLRLAGWLLVASGVLFIRCVPVVHDLLDGTAASRLLVRLPGVVFGPLPETFVAGAAAIVIGCLLLYRGTMRAAAPEAPCAWPDLSSRDWVTLLAVPAGAIAFLAILEWRRGLNHAWVAALYAGLLLACVLTLLRKDRRTGVRLEARLNWLERILLTLGAAALLLVYGGRMGSWKYSFIGDEWAFYFRASQMTESPNLWLEVGTVEDIPLTLSTWQSVFLAVLGTTNEAWRMSMAVLMLTGLLPLYLTLRHLIGSGTVAPRLLAGAGCALFFLSEPIIDWASLGKPCAAFVPPLLFAVCLWLAARARGSRVLLFASGAVSGLGCFLSALSAALPAFLISGWMIVEATAGWSVGHLRKRLLGPLTLFLSGFFLALSPVLVQLEFWQQQLGRNLASAEAHANRSLILAKTVQGSLAFLDYHGNTQFLYKNMVDPLTAILCAAGFGMARLLGWRRWLFLVFSLVAVALLTGGISQYEYPPPTRSWVVVYPVVLLAAAGLCGLAGRSTKALAVAVLLILPTAGAYNLLKLEAWNPYQEARDYPMSVLKDIQESPPETLHVLVFPSGEERLLDDILRAYGLEQRVVFLSDSAAGAIQLRALVHREKPLRPVLVRARPTAAFEDFRTAALQGGATFGPPLQPIRPSPPVPGSDLRRLFDLTNP